MKTCENCLYFIPMMTPKGIVDICMNPDSTKLYKPVSRECKCEWWYTAEILDEDQSNNATTC